MLTKPICLFVHVILAISQETNSYGNTYIWVDSMDDIFETNESEWFGSHSGYHGDDTEVRFNGGDYIYRTTNVANYASLYVLSTIRPWFDDFTIDKNEKIHLQYQINGILSDWMDVETWNNKQLPTDNDVTYLPQNADSNSALTIRYWNDGTDLSSDRVYIQKVILGFGEYHDPTHKVPEIAIIAAAVIAITIGCGPCLIYYIVFTVKRKKRERRLRMQWQRTRRAIQYQKIKGAEMDDVEIRIQKARASLREMEKKREQRLQIQLERTRRLNSLKAIQNQKIKGAEMDDVEIQKARNRAAAKREMEQQNEQIEINKTVVNYNTDDANDAMIDRSVSASYSAVHCVICLDVLLVNETSRLFCGHKFHTHCIEEYNETQGVCPLCRKSIKFIDQ